MNKCPVFLLGGDSGLLLEGLKRIIREGSKAKPDCAVTSDFSSLLRSIGPETDLTIIQISSAPWDFRSTARILRARFPDKRFVFLVPQHELRNQNRDGDDTLMTLSTNVTTAEFLFVIDKMHLGTTSAGKRAGVHARQVKPKTGLTKRQSELLRLIGDGNPVKAIAYKLDLSVRTVEFHKYRLMKSLNVSSTAELVRFAVTHNLL